METEEKDQPEPFTYQLFICSYKASPWCMSRGGLRSLLRGPRLFKFEFLFPGLVRD